MKLLNRALLSTDVNQNSENCHLKLLSYERNHFDSLKWYNILFDLQEKDSFVK